MRELDHAMRGVVAGQHVWLGNGGRAFSSEASRAGDRRVGDGDRGVEEAVCGQHR
jgi:hypothetical protein